MLLTQEPPDIEQISDALTDCNWIYLDRGYDGGVFDIELLSLERSGINRFDVTLSAFSIWLDIPNSLNETVGVSILNFGFSVELRQNADSWQVPDDHEVNAFECGSVPLHSLPDKESKLKKLLDRDFESWSIEDLAEVDITQIAGEIRPAFQKYLIEREKL